jgi:hypothetical protein
LAEAVQKLKFLNEFNASKRTFFAAIRTPSFERPYYNLPLLFQNEARPLFGYIFDVSLRPLEISRDFPYHWGKEAAMNINEPPRPEGRDIL